MNALKLIWTVLFVASLAACGTTKPLNQSEEPATADPYSYVLDGQPSSAEAVKKLGDQGVPLIFFAPVGDAPVYQVFSGKAGFETFKARYDREVGAQGFCISLKTKSTFYDLEGYGGNKFDIDKGDAELDLGGGPGITGWDDDVSSVKGADCVETWLYEDNALTGDVVVVPKGGKISKMPVNFDDGPGKSTISSILVWQ
jgi:predicted small lipoprotein YifL